MSASDEPEKTPAELEEDAGALEALRWWRETERLRDEGEANNLLAKIRRLTDKSGGSKGCHIWLGQFCRTKPYVSYRRQNFSPRRVLFEKKHGPILPRERVHMRCKTRGCVNVAHMMGGFENYFHSQVDRSGGPEACWPWTGMKVKGYGRFGTRHRVRYFAHRVAYELANGPIEGHVHHHPQHEKIVMHLCDNPPCCNPKHLRVGTDQDNMRDMIAKGRAKHQQNAPRRYEVRGGTVSKERQEQEK